MRAGDGGRGEGVRAGEDERGLVPCVFGGVGDFRGPADDAAVEEAHGGRCRGEERGDGLAGRGGDGVGVEIVEGVVLAAARERVVGEVGEALCRGEGVA